MEQQPHGLMELYVKMELYYPKKDNYTQCNLEWSQSQMFRVCTLEMGLKLVKIQF